MGIINKNIITISGKPGCGKSTMASILSDKLGYKVISSGDEFRKMARKYNMNVIDFTNYSIKNPDIDIKIDDDFLKVCKKENNIVIPTRIMAYLLAKNGINSFNIFLYSNRKNRVSRVQEREGHGKVFIDNDLKTRETQEYKKFKKLYNIDINDLKVYNLLIYTHFISSKIGYIKVVLSFNNQSIVKYIKAKDTLPLTLANIIVNEYHNLTK